MKKNSNSLVVKMFDLTKIENPKFLKNLTLHELNELSSEIRSFIIEKVSQNGGHLSSNLGVVELTVALHKVFDSPKDQFIFDVGHQSYTHKILTGRAKEFDNLRKFEGLSGYIKRNESDHDLWEAGHSSTAIAAMAGFEKHRMDINGDYKVIALVGDGSLNSGLSFEALNYLGHQKGMYPLIILNDNDMSISKNVGTLAKLLNSMRTSPTYVKATRAHWPKFMSDLKHRLANMLRGFAKSNTVFDDLGFSYYGPIDGHNMKELIKYLSLTKRLKRPIVLHVITKKGKGYLPAVNDISGSWHGVAPFTVETGLPVKEKEANIVSWSEVISHHLEYFAETLPDFQVIVPAMIQGSKLEHFVSRFPEKITDVGICESFAVCYAGALALNHKNIFVPIYSSFLQRAYDQVSHDVARQDAHVVFGVDRAGLVGEDGDTHQGIYDIAFLKHIPNMQILEPSNEIEAFQLLDYAFNHTMHPVAIRYSRSKITIVDSFDYLNTEQIKTPLWKKDVYGDRLIFIAYGDLYSQIKMVIQKENLPIVLINALFIKPMDDILLEELLSTKLPVFVLDDSIKTSGLGSSVLEFASERHLLHSEIYTLGLPEKFIEHGSVAELLKKYHLDTDSIIQTLKSFM